MPDNSYSAPTGKLFTLVIAAVVLLALLVITFSAWRSIRPGYVGIVFDKANHRVTTGALNPGWAFINPFSEAIQEYPVTIQTYSMVQAEGEGSRPGDDSIKIQSDEGQQINLDVVIQYQVEQDQAAALYTDWGGAPIETVEDSVVRQYTRSQVPVVCAQYGWEEITSTKRGDIVQQITDVLTKEFERRHLNLVSFGIREVHLPEALQQALAQKIQAQQASEQQKYLLAQAEVKAQQDVAQATGQANAVKAQAEGDAQATLTKAKAQAAANDLLSKSITPALIQYEQLQRWDGRLPMFTNGASSGVMPLIDVSKLSMPAAAPAATPGQ
ncbi:MAG TPA: prohibitin family protein [Chthoniobacteraceae bacterium]|jgi:regulator of protease activity HflC (stomatin/prohibitin superfamily)|nr:prohibitin family protein [Chthoniobacteraceae bacterium]